MNNLTGCRKVLKVIAPPKRHIGPEPSGKDWSGTERKFFNFLKALRTNA